MTPRDVTRAPTACRKPSLTRRGRAAPADERHDVSDPPLGARVRLARSTCARPGSRRSTTSMRRMLGRRDSVRRSG
jgi:hypothetical protein